MAIPLSLPEPSHHRLEQSPLRLVVCQVRHSRTVAVSDAALLLEAQKRLGDLYPEANPFEQQELIFTAGPDGANANTRQGQQGWQLKSEDGFWTVTLQAEFFSMETNAYQDWEDFSARFFALLDAVADIYMPKLEQRIGLRYVDEIERPDLREAIAWSGRIADSVLGPIADPDLGRAVRAAQQILELEGPDSSRVLLRHGCEALAPPKVGTIYRLDHDCYRQRSRPFDPSVIRETLEGLHRLALQLFQKAITPEMYRELRGLGVTE